MNLIELYNDNKDDKKILKLIRILDKLNITETNIFNTSEFTVEKFLGYTDNSFISKLETLYFFNRNKDKNYDELFIHYSDDIDINKINLDNIGEYIQIITNLKLTDEDKVVKIYTLFQWFSDNNEYDLMYNIIDNIYSQNIKHQFFIKITESGIFDEIAYLCPLIIKKQITEDPYVNIIDGTKSINYYVDVTTEQLSKIFNEDIDAISMKNYFTRVESHLGKIIHKNTRGLYIELDLRLADVSDEVIFDLIRKNCRYFDIQCLFDELVFHSYF